jgi:hypothetical protein
MTLMKKTQFVSAVALSVSLVLIGSGCGVKHDQAKSAEWTPAKAGMSRAEFFKMAAQHMQGRPASARQRHGPPPRPGAPGGAH